MVERCLTPFMQLRKALDETVRLEKRFFLTFSDETFVRGISESNH
jgi:hypothetical protein